MNVVFDLGGTFLRCGVDVGLERLTSVFSLPLAPLMQGRPSGDAWRCLLDPMRNYVAEAEATGDLENVVIAFPGPVFQQKPLCAPTVGGANAAVPVLSFAGCGSKTWVLNDVSAAAWYFAETTPYQRFLVVTVSSGIGAKLYDGTRAQAVVDDEPFAGELGHITIDPAPEAPQCDCGGHGHLGAIASGRGIERFARRAAANDLSGFGRSLCARLSNSSTELRNEDHIVPAARAGDPWSLDVIARASEPLAAALATAVQLCGLRKVFIIGGFASALGFAYESMLDSAVRKLLAPVAFGTPTDPIVEVRNAVDACLYGAAFFARSRSYARP